MCVFAFWHKTQESFINLFAFLSSVLIFLTPSTTKERVSEMQKYNFMGKDTSEKEFWRLCSLTKIEEIERVVYGEINQKKVQKLLEQTMQNETKKINTPKCNSCGARMILNNAKWGKYWHCSNIIDCISVKLI
jgi:hypothetical protein